MATLGQRVKERRKALGLSQGELARRIEMKQQSIVSIEAGAVARPKKLMELARALRTSEIWLLRGEGPEEVDGDIRYVPPEDDAAPDFIEDGDGLSAAERHQRRTLAPGEVVERSATAGLGLGGQVTAVNVDGHTVDEVRAVWRLPVDYLHTELRAREADVDFIAVEGDSMIPTLLPGDRVLVNRRHNAPGDGLFVIHDGIGPAVKRLEVVKGSSPVRVRIMSDNKLHGTDELHAEDLAVLGRVICKVTRL